MTSGPQTQLLFYPTQPKPTLKSLEKYMSTVFSSISKKDRKYYYNVMKNYILLLLITLVSQILSAQPSSKKATTPQDSTLIQLKSVSVVDTISTEYLIVFDKEGYLQKVFTPTYVLVTRTKLFNGAQQISEDITNINLPQGTNATLWALKPKNSNLVTIVTPTDFFPKR